MFEKSIFIYNLLKDFTALSFVFSSSQIYRPDFQNYLRKNLLDYLPH